VVAPDRFGSREIGAVRHAAWICMSMAESLRLMAAAFAIVVAMRSISIWATSSFVASATISTLSRAHEDE